MDTTLVNLWLFCASQTMLLIMILNELSFKQVKQIKDEILTIPNNLTLDCFSVLYFFLKNNKMDSSRFYFYSLSRKTR